MIYQNDPQLLPILNKIGCYYLCFCRIANIEDAKIINSIWLKANELGYVVKNRIMKPDSILMLLNSKSRQLGQTIGNETNFWSSNQNYNWIIEERTVDTEIGTHFVLLDKYKTLIYDPYTKPYKFTCKPRYIYYS